MVLPCRSERCLQLRTTIQGKSEKQGAKHRFQEIHRRKGAKNANYRKSKQERRTRRAEGQLRTRFDSCRDLRSPGGSKRRWLEEHIFDVNILRSRAFFPFSMREKHHLFSQKYAGIECKNEIPSLPADTSYRKAVHI